MRKLIVATAALAFVASTALSPVLAQDKSGTAAPAATSGDTNTMSKDSMKKTTKKSKKTAKMKKTGDDAMKK
jgi:hypothetical protein